MKKTLLVSALSSIFMAPFVSFANDDQEYLNPRSETQLHSQRQMINQKNSQASQMPKKHQLGITEEDMRIPGESSSKSRNMSTKKGWGSTNAQEKKSKSDEDSDDDNPNLSDLATPAPKNIHSNLAISDDDRALNRQMMLSGPKGGFQNSQPRGIGGSSVNF